MGWWRYGTGSGVAVVSGAAAAVVGGAGIFGTTVGASGVTGVLMSAGLIASTPVWVPVVIAGAGVGISYGAYRHYALRRKLQATPTGEEAHFTEKEAKIVERLVRWFAKNEKDHQA